MSQKITRRRFLQAGAAVLAVAAMTACGGNADSGEINPTPAKPEPGSKNNTNVGTLDIKNRGAGTTGSKFAADKKYLFLRFTVKNLTSSEIVLHKTDFTVDPVVGAGSVGFAPKLQKDAVMSAEQKIPANETVEFLVFFEMTGYDLLANAMKITFRYNGKKIVYTAKLEKTVGEMVIPTVTVSEVTDA